MYMSGLVEVGYCTMLGAGTMGARVLVVGDWSVPAVSRCWWSVVTNLEICLVV